MLIHSSRTYYKMPTNDNIDELCISMIQTYNYIRNINKKDDDRLRDLKGF